MLDRHLRPLTARILDPLTGRATAIPPWTLTTTGLVVGLGAAALAARGWWVVALAAWWASRLADGLDGEVARRTGTASDRGGYLDLVADVVVYGALPLGVAAGIGTERAWMVAAALLATFYVNVVSLTLLAALLEKRRAGAEARGEPTSVVLPAGLVEGTETVAFFSVALAVPSVAVWTMAIMAVAVAVTALGRSVQGMRLLAPDSRRAERART